MDTQLAVGPSIRVSILHGLPLVREALTRVLETSGVSVIAGHDEPRRFLAHLGADCPNVAILDLLQPASSQPLLEQLRQEHPGVQVLVVSEGSDPETVADWHRAGAAGYLDKLTSGCQAIVHAVQALAAFDPPQTAPAPVASSVPGPLDRLTAREAEVFAYVAAGWRNASIGSALGICERTVKAHVSSLYRKLGQENRTQLALLARALHVRPAPRA